MTANTGRTTSKWVEFHVDDSAGTLRKIPVNNVSGAGLTFDEVELTAYGDAAKGVLFGHPDMTISISGPFDTTASTGSHIVLSGIVGLQVPLSLDIRVGMRHAWEAGEPQVGLTATATSGFLCSEYIPDVNAGTYSAKFRLYPGSDLPAWGTAAET